MGQIKKNNHDIKKTVSPLWKLNKIAKYDDALQKLSKKL